MTFKVDYFKYNSDLMFLIQQITSESAEDILLYFYSAALEIAEATIETQKIKKKKLKVNKTFKWFYKDTKIPFKLSVYTRWGETFGLAYVPLYIVVQFGGSIKYANSEEILNTVVEKGLDLSGSSSLPKFVQPATRVPVGCKKLTLK